MNRLEKMAVALTFVLGTTACSAPTPDKTIYHGPLTDIKGDKLITDTRFQMVTQAMQGSGDELLIKIAGDLNTLHSATTLPSELDGLISTGSVPLSIVEIPNVKKSFADYDINNKSETFNSVTSGVATPVNFIYPPDIAIGIGSPAQNPLVESLFLTKEYLSEMLQPKLAEEFSQTGAATVTDSNGNPITDPSTIVEAGLSIVAKQGGNDNTDVHKIIDVFPAMMMSLSARDLVAKGALPSNPEGTGNFQDVSVYLSDHPDIENSVREIMHEWAVSDNLTGPDGIVEQIVSPDMLKAILDISNNTIY